jgi:hypothetical protein
MKKTNFAIPLLLATFALPANANNAEYWSGTCWSGGRQGVGNFDQVCANRQDAARKEMQDRNRNNTYNNPNTKPGPAGYNRPFILPGYR